MNQTFVITDNRNLQTSIDRYLRFNHGISSTPVSFQQHSFSSARIVPTFRQIADIIESAGLFDFSPQNLRHAIAIVDLCDDKIHELAEINLIHKGSIGLSAVVAMLALTFPEMHWIFITPYRSIDDTFLKAHVISATNSLSDVLSLHEKKFISLFDPTNLRNNIREMILEKPEDQTIQYIPLRKQLAAAIDEEEAYAFFSAYTAYRIGFRSHVVLSHSMMQSVFQEESCIFSEQITLLFEDIYLNFPDQDLGIHYSNLYNRDRKYSKLQEAMYRVIITVGHRINRDAWQSNIEYLCNLRHKGKFCKLLYKPIAGIFDIWKKSGLRHWLRFNGGLAEKFEWPPQHKNHSDIETQGHHSAPGRLLEIAERLIQRAERILNSAISVPEAIHGALLALEAQELLGNKTPTTALEALSLKHQLEVSAECMFYGVEYNFDVKSRFKDIEKEVKSIGRWFNPRTHRLSELNAEISIMSDLMQRFRQYNQFDEEQECLQRIRQLHRHLWLNKYKTWAWLFYPFRAYIEFLLGRLHRFVGALVFWFLSFSFLFDACLKNKHHDIFIEMLRGPAHTITTFFGMQPSYNLIEMENQGLFNLELLTLFAIVLGFIHLGIFISHVYSIISRR
ncbi:hypothetical protein JXB12_12145 [candidate division KSB1 bacterium]|nr:hypothetical protein [candidate division KSB1 bacterium]